MANENRCPQCGSDMPPNAPQGVCPQCLMKLGLPTNAAASATPPGGFVPPQPEAISDQFPQLEIIELLGQGGMGAVYKARQKQLDRLVALKILPPEVSQDPAFAERFTREARSLAKLNHPNIVTVHDFGHTDQNVYFFIMEFVEGTDLRRVIHTRDLAPQQALAIVPQVCDALQYAHEEGIVHRDIKPENILLDKKGRVKIADFGLARLLDRPATAMTLTQVGQRMGTPHYMAPEQIEHPHEVDHRADIYSLGVVFYEMLTGELPLGRFAPPSKKVHVDVRLDEVVLHTLEKEPARRYQQVSEVKTDIEAIGAQRAPAVGEQAKQRPPQPWISEDAVQDARQALRTPAIGLRITGMLDLLFIVAMLFMAGHAGLPGLVEMAIIAVAMVVPGIVILLGGMAMSKCKSHGLSFTAAILAVMPIHPASFVGLPFGIWALVILSRPGIRRAFTGTGDRSADAKPGSASPPDAGRPADSAKWDARMDDELEAAWQSLRIPAVGLIITGLIDLLGIVGILLMVGYFSLARVGHGFPIIPMTIPFVACLPGLVILTGARRMSRLSSHGLSVAAAILAVLPIHAGFILGLPMGIWALIVLTRSETQHAFALAAQPGAPKRKGVPLWPIILVVLVLALLILTPILLIRMWYVPSARYEGEIARARNTYQAVAGSDGIAKPLTSEPNAPGYETAQGTATGKIRVGPTLFAVETIARWDRNAMPLFEDGLGNKVKPYDFKTPDYTSQAPWMDIANIYITPDSGKYDILELRVFDHRTRQLLQVGESLALGYGFDPDPAKQTLANDKLEIDKAFTASVIQLRSVGKLLPPTVDVWMRVLHTPENSPMWRLDPIKGSSASLGEVSMLFRELRDGQWSYATKSGDSDPSYDPGQFPVGRVEWVKRDNTDAPLCTAAFDFINAPAGPISSAPKYQIAAIAKDGARHIPDYPHFITASRAVTRVIQFDLPADQLSYFEIRPFLGRDRFFFDGLKLPYVSTHPSTAPPPVKIPVGGKEVDLTSDALSPARLHVRVLKGKRATGVRSQGLHAWVRMNEEPFENTDSMITLIYDVEGLAAKSFSFGCFDTDGRRIPMTGRHGFSSNPQGFTVGYYETKIPIQKIAHIELTIKDDK